MPIAWLLAANYLLTLSAACWFGCLLPAAGYLPMKISVIIRCYNEERHIGRLLAGLAQQTEQDYEIVLVDSGSTDRTLAIAREYPVKIVTLRPDEFSFGRSLNLGCRAAQGEFLVIASAHVYPIFRDWLAQMVAPFTDSRVGLVYGKQCGAETSHYAEQQVFARWFPATSQAVQTHPFCNNANAAVRRALWEAQPYDETLTGLEDLAWAVKLLQSGHHLSYAAAAEVVHVHEETWPQVLNRYRREAIAFKRIFPQARLGLGSVARLWAANIASDYYHAVREGVLSQHWRDIVLFRGMQFWGTYRGYRQRGPLSPELRERFYYPRGLARPTTETLVAVPRPLIDYAANN